VSETSRRILVVEDHPLNMELVTDLLESRGCLVLQATDGLSGIEIARQELPDLILMDVSLPGIDGLEATRRLQADDLTRVIPIVAVTAHAMKGDQDKVEEAGCRGYLCKPIDTRTFADSVLSFLNEVKNEG
jgi:two-component system, cell cycle response regulator DivK